MDKRIVGYYREALDFHDSLPPGLVKDQSLCLADHDLLFEISVSMINNRTPRDMRPSNWSQTNWKLTRRYIASANL